MSARLLCRLTVVLAILVVSGVWTAYVHGCAAAFPRNQPVEIANESAIIVWDPATKTQHFIRRASFTTAAKDFGFLVPTPSQPQLVEASDDAFKELADLTKPRVEQKPRPSGGGCALGCSKAAAPADKAAAGSVDVLQEGTLGGYDYKVLKIVGGKVDVLKQWLLERAYEFPAELEAWVKPYVEADWIITAFKVNKEAADKPGVATKAIRMTFQTEKPFFPYREPEDKTPADKRKVDRRLLRVFFLSTSRMQGTLGNTAEVWPGQTVWANKISDANREKILKLLQMPPQTPTATWWLTEFEDHSSPRPGKEDVYFSPSQDQAPVERPPHVVFVGLSRPDVMSLALVVCFVVSPLVRRWRRPLAA
jgi:hypothetical protein